MLPSKLLHSFSLSHHSRDEFVGSRVFLQVFGFYWVVGVDTNGSGTCQAAATSFA